MNFIDFFAGVGGFRRGLELSGHKCVGFCEWDKYATASYTSMHLITDKQRKYLSTLTLKMRQKEILKDEYRNGEWYSNDIRNVDARCLPAADCWTFGAPCQDFSIAGKRAGLDGDRSSLIREIFRLLEEQKEQDRPEWLIYENVKGMLSSNRGLDYLSILSEMDRLGYDIEWQNINSKWFVPQNRERIYTIGHLRRYGRRKILPITGTDGENSISIIAHRDGYRRNTQTFSSDGITEALDTGQGGGRGHHVAIPCFCDMNYGAGIKFTENSRTLQARYSKGISNRCGETSGVAIKIIGEVNSSQDGKVHDISGISRCHSAGHNNSPKVAIPINVKCININDKNGKERSQQDRVYAIDGDMTALNSSLGGRHNIAIPVLTPDRTNKRQNGRSFKENGDPMFTLTAQDRHGVGVEVLGGLYTNPSPNYNRGILDGISRTLKADSHPAGVGLRIIDPQGRNRKEVSLKDICPTLRSETHGNVPDVCIDVSGNSQKQSDGIYVEMPEGFMVYAIWYEKEKCYIAIRKLTPKECFRLQGWTDDYFEKAAFVNSDSQLYKQAGNGVTVDVVYVIGKRIAEHENKSLEEFSKCMNKPEKGEQIWNE